MEKIAYIFSQFKLIDIFDILAVTFAISSLIMMIRDTRAIQLVKGIFYVLLAYLISSFLGLNEIGGLRDRTLTFGIIAIPIVFQDELRKVLEEIGRGSFFHRRTANEEQIDQMFKDIIEAVDLMSEQKIGALIVLERKTGLREYIETGVPIDGVVSAPLLLNIFYRNSPLHDGAVMIRDNRIMAASCYLPLSSNPDIAQELGTRHRASIGITEQSDSLSIVVSEETGTVSLAQNGKLIRYLDGKMLKDLLAQLYYAEETKAKSILPTWLRLGGKQNE